MRKEEDLTEMLNQKKADHVNLCIRSLREKGFIKNIRKILSNRVIPLSEPHLMGSHLKSELES